MADELLKELMKRDKKLQAILGQRELTQAERDEWEDLVRKVTAIQDEMQASADPA